MNPSGKVDDEGSNLDSYHDDPTLFQPKRVRKKISQYLVALLVLMGGIFFLQTTLAANLNLNSGSALEFGQGISQTVACSGSDSLILTPNSTFANQATAGSHLLQNIVISSIPTSCRGVDFTIRAYTDSGDSPLALFNTNSNTVIVETFDTPGTGNDSATAWAGQAGISVSANTTGSSFTITFDNPVALSGDVSKLTLESSKPYYIGGPGAAGGTVYYVSTRGFYCGPLFTARCKYLEAAPNTWSGGVNDPTKPYALTANVAISVPNIDSSTEFSKATLNSSAKIGFGIIDTNLIVAQNGACARPLVIASCLYGAGAGQAYTKTYLGVTYSDWYLPDLAELNQLVKFANGSPWTSDATLASSTSGAVAVTNGFVNGIYLSSSEYDASHPQIQAMGGTQYAFDKSKSAGYYVRPIRAF